MDANMPRLFDVPEPEPPNPVQRSARGRNRETWTRVVTAEVSLTDAEAVAAAAARAEHGAVTIALEPRTEGEDAAAEDTPAGGDRAVAASDPFDALAWLVWPSDGLEPLLDAEAFRLLSVECEVEPASVDHGLLTWAVTVKLTDVHELRNIANRAHPDQAAEIADSLATAWQCAADPFAPVRAIPGIVWHPRHVEVRHEPARHASGTTKMR